MEYNGKQLRGIFMTIVWLFIIIIGLIGVGQIQISNLIDRVDKLEHQVEAQGKIIEVITKHNEDTCSITQIK